jgi:prepilin-type N-terminal cleavage/methylation domain-containing protein
MVSKVARVQIKTLHSNRSQRRTREFFGVDDHLLRLRNAEGMTLIELIVVISLIAIIGSVVVLRLDSILGWKYESELRKIAHTLQLVRNDSVQRQEQYRVVVNLDLQNYSVRREVPLDPGEIRDVDYLKNLRTQGEKARRQEKETEDLKSLEAEFSEEDSRKGESLENRFYQSIFADPHADVRLGVPLTFPSLAELQPLDSGVRIRDIEIGGERVESGTVALRFLPRAAAPEALIHVVAGEQVYTLVLHPNISNVQIVAKDLDAEDAFESVRYEEDTSARISN